MLCCGGLLKEAVNINRVELSVRCVIGRKDQSVTYCVRF